MHLYKRYKLGQVDLKPGLIMGLFAEFGVFLGKHVMTGIRQQHGDAGTDLYVSVVFIVVLSIVSIFIMRDVNRSASQDPLEKPHKGKLAAKVQSLHIPGTMLHLSSINASVSILVIIPLGFATGLLASFIAVGGFIGVPAMMYIIGVPAIVATATELVVAFVMGLGGSMLCAWEGFVDIRLSMLILAGSLFGVQIGVIATTYIKDVTVKKVMISIMIIVVLSRMFMMPVYLSSLNIIEPIQVSLATRLEQISSAILVIALLTGAISIIAALIYGASEQAQKSKTGNV